jgi:polyisoprenoid-binding protein YceI
MREGLGVNAQNSQLWMTFRVFVGLLVSAIGLCGQTLRAQEMTLELDPTQTRIEFTLPATLHTVHGTFALKSGTIRFNPSTGSVSGVVVVDAASGDSENKGRDRKMHEEILESQQYPEITFTPSKLSGNVELQGDSSVEVAGILRLHGANHSMTLTLPVQTKGNTVTASTHFVIPYVAWGLKNPSTFLLHVGDTVDIEISAQGRVAEKEASPVQHH